MAVDRREVLLGGAALLAAGTGARAQARRGGEIVFAQEANVPTLDQHFTSTASTRTVAMNMYEMLVARGERNNPVGDLAESWEASPDGLTYTFRVRDGVSFHDGSAMTARDVLASWQRYQRVGAQRRSLAAVASLEAPDARTFVVKLQNPQPTFIENVSAFSVPITIHPAALADREGGRMDPIGTGPFRFGEFVPDSHVLLRRFEGYKPNGAFAGTDGFAGRKEALVDAVRFRIVPDGGARVAGLESGAFHVVEEVPARAAERLRSNPQLRMLRLDHWWLHSAFVSQLRPPTDNLEVRRAIQVALDMEAIMAIATDGAYALQPALQFPNTPYHVDAGKEFYNVADPARAREHLKRGGYNGQELVLLTNSSFATMNAAAVVMAEQLRAVGMRVKVDVFDWATALARQNDRMAWNFWFTGHGTGPSVGPTTALPELVAPNHLTGVPDPVLDKIYEELLVGPSVEARREIFGRFQARVYENVSFLKFGDFARTQATRASVEGFKPFRISRFWNVSLG